MADPVTLVFRVIDGAVVLAAFVLGMQALVRRIGSWLLRRSNHRWVRTERPNSPQSAAGVAVPPRRLPATSAVPNSTRLRVRL